MTFVQKCNLKIDFYAYKLISNWGQKIGTGPSPTHLYAYSYPPTPPPPPPPPLPPLDVFFVLIFQNLLKKPIFIVHAYIVHVLEGVWNTAFNTYAVEVLNDLRYLCFWEHPALILNIILLTCDFSQRFLPSMLSS